jgi:hypothetical protein
MPGAGAPPTQAATPFVTRVPDVPTVVGGGRRRAAIAGGGAVVLAVAGAATALLLAQSGGSPSAASSLTSSSSDTTTSDSATSDTTTSDTTSSSDSPVSSTPSTDPDTSSSSSDTPAPPPDTTSTPPSCPTDQRAYDLAKQLNAGSLPSDASISVVKCDSGWATARLTSASVGNAKVVYDMQDGSWKAVDLGSDVCGGPVSTAPADIRSSVNC